MSGDEDRKKVPRQKFPDKEPFYMRFDASVGLRERIQYIKKKTHASSMSEVIRRAVNLYDVLLQEKAKGGEVYIRTKKGSESKVILY